jgi:polysaccharide pyruvyl transferase WcaK-like protein
MKMFKPIFYFHVRTSNRGDIAIAKSITDAIKKRIDIPFAFFNIKTEKLTKDRIEQLNNDASCLMIAGSGVYSNAKTSSGWYFDCNSSLFNKIKVPIFLIGLGCNNNLVNDIFGSLTSKAKKSIKLINDLAIISTVRDERTRGNLREIGIKKHEIMLDPAYFLNTRKVLKEKKVAINIAQHAPILGRFDGGKEGKRTRQKNIQIFVQISQYLISKGYKIIFICHDALEQSIVIDLKKLIPSLQFINTDNIDDMLYEYSKCAFTIAMKMHSAIMSIASGTPAINVYYDQKSIEFLKMLCSGNLGISVFDDYYDELKNKVDYLMTWLDEYTQYFDDIKKNNQPIFNNLIDRICNTLKNIN